jgi:hypothetical protein
MRFRYSIPLASIVLSLWIAVPAVAQTGILTAQNSASRIYLRLAPTLESAAPSYGVVGDRVTILEEQTGSDRALWYLVQFERSGVQGWLPSDFVQIENAAFAPTQTPSIDALAPSISPQPVTFNAEQIQYFLDVAMGAEWGNPDSRIRKWTGDVQIRYLGTPTAEDLITLAAVMDEINQLTNGAIRLQFAQAEANLEIYFVPEPDFRNYEPNYVPTNLGFFWAWWNLDNTLNRARILISTEGITQQERSHLIREELTQSLGLMQDSLQYADSIFYQGWTDVTSYSDLDRTLIQMLYRPDIRPGMERAEVEQILNRIQSQ